MDSIVKFKSGKWETSARSDEAADKERDALHGTHETMRAADIFDAIALRRRALAQPKALATKPKRRSGDGEEGEEGKVHLAASRRTNGRTLIMRCALPLSWARMHFCTRCSQRFISVWQRVR